MKKTSQGGLGHNREQGFKYAEMPGVSILHRGEGARGEEKPPGVLGGRVFSL